MGDDSIKEELLGDAIRRQRHAAGLSQPALARELTVTEKSIYHWERGLNEPNYENYDKLVSVLGELPTPLRTTYESRQFHLSDVLVAKLAERVAETMKEGKSTTTDS